jgi:putative zinc finger protein
MEEEKTTCPTDEELAAFVDGTLEAGDRARVVEHLAGCERCYQVVSGVLQFEEESAADPALEDIVPFPFDRPKPVHGPRPNWVWTLPAAAAILVGVGVATFFALGRFRAGSGELASVDLVKPLAGQARQLVILLWEPAAFRGGKSATALSSASFLIGVEAVDLQLGLAAGNRDAALKVVQETRRLLAGLDIRDQEAESFYGDLERKIETGGASLRYAREAANREGKLGDFPLEEPYLAFGKWAEAGRLSARAEQRAFFADRGNHRFLERLRRGGEEDGLTRDELHDLAEDLNRIETAFSAPATADLKPLAAAFERIIRYYENRLDQSDVLPSPAP